MESSNYKTRKQIASEYGITRKTLYNWLKKEEIKLEHTLISPEEQEMIYEIFGNPKME